MVGFLRCVSNNTDIKLYAVIHVRGLDSADDLQTVQKLGMFCKSVFFSCSFMSCQSLSKNIQLWRMYISWSFTLLSTWIHFVKNSNSIIHESDWMIQCGETCLSAPFWAQNKRHKISLMKRLAQIHKVSPHCYLVTFVISLANYSSICCDNNISGTASNSTPYRHC